MRKQVPNLKQLQSEQLRSIGQQLCQARQSLAYSIEEVSSKTLIQRRLLQAIEQGQLDQLPEPIYVQGFIRRYGDALELNGNQLAAQFSTEPNMLIRAMSWKDMPAAQLRPLHLYVAYIVVILGAVSGLSHVLNRTAPLSSGQIPPAVAPVIQAPPAQRSDASPAPSTVKDAALSDDEIRVEVTLTDRSWMLIVADKKTQFEGILNSGEKRTWTAEEELILTAGNAGGVLVSLNDGDAEKLGDPGSVQKVKFSPDANPAVTGLLHFPLSLSSPRSD